jgi:1-phosphofructokinase
VDWTVWVLDFGPGRVNRVQREQIDAGGKAVNVASFPADCGLRSQWAPLPG